MSARFRLRRADGEVYLERWGVEFGKAGRFGGIFLHHMSGPDPGVDLHDHPWWFSSLVLRGGYSEYRAEIDGGTTGAWAVNDRPRWSWRSMRLNEAHTIHRIWGPTWTLVIHGPRRRDWGFYPPEGWVFHLDYDDKRRGLKVEAHEGDLD